MSAVGAEILDRKESVIPPERPVRWNPLTRIAFRFSFGYFGLFCLLFTQIPFAFAGPLAGSLSENAVLWEFRALRPVIEPAGRLFFDTDVVLHEDSGSGDQYFIWTFVLCVLIAAAVATLVWTALDRRRPNYRQLQAWFLLFIRMCLGGQMLLYGFAKAIPTQMPEPTLAKLLQPYGEFSPASVLWNQVGSSPAYEILLGCAEVLGGLLLFLPRTATLGAMLSLVSLAQVFVLNMTFDVPVKILAFHLMLLSMVLLAPQARRLANMLVLNRPSEPATQPDPFRGNRTRRIAIALQVALGLWMAVGFVHTGLKYWNEGGGGSPKPPLYGIWAVSEFTQDGVPVPPLTTDETRWQRVVFDVAGMTYQKMDGSLVPAVPSVDAAAHKISVSAPPERPDAQPAQIADFTFEQLAPDRLTLNGQLNGRPVTITLQQVDLNGFPLRGRGFSWVQDYPYFR
ncbi:DoxX family protein [Nocardia pseudovaccinii]|uniref:DoxX family protein n=1 Tax=Nocardia pseudovaccinii TaxID=189540 RepID=UPI000A02F36B|nr:DoxX family protein [Nocardia pseudovaccinii]